MNRPQPAPLVLLLCSFVAVANATDFDRRPNIVIVVCDDMGFSDLGCYGGEIDTPNLDRLAANGLRFTDFHNDAKCSQTRAAIMTGLWHHQSDMLRKSGNVTIAEVLRDAGYATLMSGKWHLHGNPRDRGFDRYFGFLSGCINFFTGEDWQTGKNLMRLERSEFSTPDDFYSTDAFTDYAIEFLNERPKDKPFFLYLAHNAPHFPLHALPEDIKKYEGRYRVGWDVIRQQRHERLNELGIIDETWRLSSRDPKVEAWSELTPTQIEFLEPMMAVYAAMVDRLDQNVGRLVAHLEEQGQLENTLIIFFSDNGACPYQRLRTEVTRPGGKESDIAYDARWANMCNTPLRLYKQYAHEGGTTTPMIVHWPKRIKARGEISRYTGHLVDLMPTVVELAGGTYPSERNGEAVHPMEGQSLLPAFQGKEYRGEANPIFWEYQGNHAIRVGEWKLVAERSKSWELYHLATDRSETRNLVSQHAERVAEMAERYDAWATRVGARTHEESVARGPSTQSQLFDLP